MFARSVRADNLARIPTPWSIVITDPLFMVFRIEGKKSNIPLGFTYAIISNVIMAPQISRLFFEVKRFPNSFIYGAIKSGAPFSPIS